MIEGEDLELFERSLRHATQTHTGAALDTALDDLGWQDALAVDTHAAVSLLFELQGAANAVSSALDQALAHALGHQATGTGPARDRLRDHGLTAGRTDSAVVLPALGQWRAPGALDDGRLTLRGVGTASLGERATALVVARADDAYVALEVEANSLSRRAVDGIDPSLGLVEVTGDVGAARDLGPVDWRAAVVLGQLALGHELVGASRRMLELAREHALERIQFGRPIAMFQAVRHRLAETLVAIEAAAATLDAAWSDRDGIRPEAMAIDTDSASKPQTHEAESVSTGPESVSTSAPQAAAMAKATAGRGARVAARHCQQVLAGIGFTTEHPFHRYVKRILVLEQVLGSTQYLTRELGSDILEHRQLPALLPLLTCTSARWRN